MNNFIDWNLLSESWKVVNVFICVMLLFTTLNLTIFDREIYIFFFKLSMICFTIGFIVVVRFPIPGIIFLLLGFIFVSPGAVYGLKKVIS